MQHLARQNGQTDKNEVFRTVNQRLSLVADEHSRQTKIMKSLYFLSPYVTLLLIATCASSLLAPAAGQETQQAESRSDSDERIDENLLEMTSTLVWDSIDVLREQHVNPPLPNQIILNGLQRLFPNQSRELYRQVEKIKTREDLKSVVRSAYAKVIESRRAKQEPQSHQPETNNDLNNPVALANLFLASVPGSPRLESAYQAGINQQLAENRYVGIGIAVLQEGQYTLISVPFRGGPAHKAGVLHGDRILKVDGASMVGKPLGDVVMALRGPKDSDVDVVVSQPGKAERSYKMTRGVVPISSVKGVAEEGETGWIYAFPKNRNVAYLEVTDITGSTAAELRSALRQIARQKFKSLVIDFRNCFRGELHHITMVADVLISAENLGHWTDAKGLNHPLKLRKTSELPDLPVSLIVSPAQTNEIKLLIAGLVKHRKASIVGQLNTAPIQIRGNSKLPSGAGTLTNVFVGTASLDVDQELSLQRPNSRVSQANRFRSGVQKQMDSQIREAIERSQEEG